MNKKRYKELKKIGRYKIIFSFILLAVIIIVYINQPRTEIISSTKINCYDKYTNIIQNVSCEDIDIDYEYISSPTTGFLKASFIFSIIILLFGIKDRGNIEELLKYKRLK